MKNDDDDNAVYLYSTFENKVTKCFIQIRQKRRLLNRAFFFFFLSKLYDFEKEFEI